MERKFKLLGFSDEGGWTYDISDDVKEILIQVGISCLVDDAISSGIFDSLMEQNNADPEGS